MANPSVESAWGRVAKAPAGSWRSAGTLLSILGAAVVVVLFALGAWVLVAFSEHRVANANLDASLSSYRIAFQDGIDRDLGAVVALHAYFDASEAAVSRQQFDVYAGQMLQWHPGLQRMCWVPRVGREQRAAYEQAAVHDGVSGYHIKSVAADDSLVTAAQHDQYFPIYYSTEDPKTSPIYGLDLADGGVRQRALDRARDSGGMAASSVFLLHNGSGNRHGFFVVLPVYRSHAPHGTLEERRRNLLGFTRGVFQIEPMIDRILAAVPNSGQFLVSIYRADAAAGEAPIYAQSPRLAADPQWDAAQGTAPGAVSGSRYLSFNLDIADLRWTVLLYALPNVGVVAQRNEARIELYAAVFVFLGSLFVVGVAVAYIRVSGRSYRRVESANRTISELALTDPLTRLANRRAFVERLDAVFAAARRAEEPEPVVVLYLDIDHFKDVNDTLGHSAGDLLLAQVAERLQRVIRATDLVARFGGDEFALIVTGAADPLDVDTLAEKICQVLGEPYRLHGSDVHVTASIGISNSSEHCATPEVMMAQADLALYRAKDDGRDCFRFFSERLEEEVRARVAVADEMRLAYQRGEFELCYQPQVEIASGRIVGLEALVRWNHPRHGRLMPSYFVPIAERTGFIKTLGQWAFDQACRQLSLWRQEGVPQVIVAVNVSAGQFKGRSELDREIAVSLERWGVRPGEIEIELTESVLMSAVSRFTEAWERLRAIGVRIAIDDFGTGYSSLSYLTRLPVSRIKIAQELVLRITLDRRNATVVRTAVRLAHDLGIEVIAEGLENQAQADFLIAAGCERAQGFYYSQGVSAARALELLRIGTITPRDEVQPQ